MKTVTKRNLSISIKIKIHIHFDPAILFIGNYSIDTPNTSGLYPHRYKDIITTMFVIAKY